MALLGAISVVKGRSGTKVEVDGVVLRDIASNREAIFAVFIHRFCRDLFRTIAQAVRGRDDIPGLVEECHP